MVDTSRSVNILVATAHPILTAISNTSSPVHIVTAIADPERTECAMTTVVEDHGKSQFVRTETARLTSLEED